MIQAETDNSITSRRRFLAVAATASAVSAGSLAVAAMPAAPQDDRKLLELEEQIFEQYNGACAFNDEILRLSKIWTDKLIAIRDAALSREVQAGVHLTANERWVLFTDMPEYREHSRMCELQAPFYERMEALIKQMYATPAYTAEGRHAKVMVLLGVILGEDWRERDEETDYQQLMTRRLLIEFVGGEPGEQLRNQFA
jgi:hypothetical protein